MLGDGGDQIDSLLEQAWQLVLLAPGQIAGTQIADESDLLVRTNPLPVADAVFRFGKNVAFPLITRHIGLARAIHE